MSELWLVKRPHSSAWPSAGHSMPTVRAWNALEQDLSYRYLNELPQWVLEDATNRVFHLQAMQTLWGSAAQQVAGYHYVVETDVLPDMETEFNAWYEQEHLPGLASVPGTVRAVRYRQDAGRPRYFACYDLVHAEVLGSPAWLKVRGTPWSDRVRPAFHNTQRTLFRRAP